MQTKMLQRVSAVTGFVATSDTGNMFTFAQQISNIFYYIVLLHRSYLLDGWLSTALANHSLLNIADTEDFPGSNASFL